MKTIIIDPGHGGEDSGATVKGYQEKDLNLALGLKIRDILFERCAAKVLMTRTTDKTVSLPERTQFANREKADYFCSIHHNAGGGSGFESYIYNGPVSQKTIQAQETIHDAVSGATMPKYNLRNRGRKKANLHVLRKTQMPAILLEILFLDNTSDRQLLTNKLFFKDAAEAIANGIAKAMALQEDPARSAASPRYQVIAGSFKDQECAENRAAFLTQQQIDAFVVRAVLSGETYYRVQAGSFRDRANAEERIKDLRKTGLGDPFIVTVFTTDHDSSPEQHIIGKMLLTSGQMDTFVKSLNPEAPALGKYYEEFGNHYNIRGDIAFAQTLHETNDFRFTGTVHPEQNNYAGIGATGGRENGASFSTPREGVLAQIQHLYAYAETTPLPEGYPLVDPRFDLVRRGSAKTWLALNGKWAVPGDDYGDAILSIYRRMADDSAPGQPEKCLKLRQRLFQFLRKRLCR